MVEQTKDMVGNKDEIGMDFIEKQREQILRDIKNHEEQLEDIKKTKERHARQLARDKRIFAIRLEGENHRRIEPSFKYEESDEYWNLIKDTLTEEAEYNLYLGEGKQKGMANQIENIEKALEQMRADLAKLDEGGKDE